MAPPPSLSHQDFEYELESALRSIAARRGLKAFHNVGLMEPTMGWDEYRVPDLSVVHPSQLSERAIEGRAELVVEILSPRDESRAKLAFYASRSVREVWLIEPGSRHVEVLALHGRDYHAVAPIAGMIRAPALEIELRVVAGPRLRLIDGALVIDV